MKQVGKCIMQPSYTPALGSSNLAAACVDKNLLLIQDDLPAHDKCFSLGKDSCRTRTQSLLRSSFTVN